MSVEHAFTDDEYAYEEHPFTEEEQEEVIYIVSDVYADILTAAYEKDDEHDEWEEHMHTKYMQGEQIMIDVHEMSEDVMIEHEEVIRDVLETKNYDQLRDIITEMSFSYDYY